MTIDHGNLDAAWESFRSQCVSGTLSPEEADELKNVFLAGAFAVWVGVRAAMMTDDKAILDALHARLRAFQAHHLAAFQARGPKA